MPIATIIIAIADYRKDASLQLRELGAELDGIQQGLRPAQQAGICEVITLAEATPKKIVQAFDQAQGPVVGFHFAGHNGGYGLLLDQDQKATAKGLSNFLGQQSDLQFVFLNACATHQHVDQLHRAGIKAIISTSQAIYDQVAREVATSFYQRLGQGSDIQSSFEYYQAQYDLQEDDQNGQQRGLALSHGEEAGFQKYPWRLAYRPGASDKVSKWSLARAAGNPLFGLPLISEEDYSLPQDPFRYLKPYTQEQAKVFFGRGREIRQLYDWLHQAFQPAILLLYGRSGVGKSSLLAAGLLPRIEKQYQIKYHRRDPSLGLAAGLAQCLGIKEEDDLAAAWLALEEKHDQALCIILDQVEECFTQANGQADELVRLCHELNKIFTQVKPKPKGKIILSYRKEYHPDIQELLQAQLLPYSNLHVQRLDEESIKEAVLGLTQEQDLINRYKLEVEDGLADVIASDLVRDPDGSVAPMLQVLLSKLWFRAKEKDGSPKFTEADYIQIRRDGLLLDDFLLKELKVIKEEHPVVMENGLALDVLYFLTTNRGTADQKKEAELLTRYAGRENQIRSLLNSFQDHFLIQKTGKESAPEWRLAHDTLAPLVRSLFQSSNRPGQVADRILSSGFSTDDEKSLLNQGQAKAVEKGKLGMRSWTKEEEELISKSLGQAKRQRQLRRFFIGAIGLAAVFALLLFYNLYRSAAKENRLLIANSLAQRADAVLNQDPTQAVALYQQSLDQRNDPQIKKKLASAKATSILYKELWVDTSLQVNAAAFSPNGQYLVLSQSDEGLEVKVKKLKKQEDSWILEDTLSGASLTINHILITDEGTVVAGALNHRIYRWNRLGQLDDQYGKVDDINGLVLHPNGKDLAIGYPKGIILLDLDTRQRDSISLGAPPSSIGTSLKGSNLFSVSESQDLLQVIGWDNKAILKSLSIEPVDDSRKIQGISSFIYDEKYQEIIFGTIDGWTITNAWDGQKLSPISDIPVNRGDPLDQIIGSKAEDWIAYTSLSNQININKSSGIWALLGHLGPIQAMYQTSDKKLISIGAEGRLLEWQIKDDEIIELYTPKSYLKFFDLQVSTEQSTLIAGASNVSVLRFGLRQNEAHSPLYLHNDRVTNIALSSNQKQVLSGDRSGQIVLWELNSGKVIASNTDTHSAPIAAITTHNNQWLTADEDGKLILWDQRLKTSKMIFEDAGQVGDILFLNQDQILISSAKNGLVKYDLSTGSTKPFMSGQNMIIDLEIMPSTGLVWGISLHGHIYQWDQDGTQLSSLNDFTSANELDLAISPQGLVAANNYGVIYFYNQEGDLIHRISPGFDITSIQFGPKGEYLYALTEASDQIQIPSQIIRCKVPTELIKN